MKKSSSFLLTCLAGALLLLSACQKHLDFSKDIEVANTPLPGQPTYCRIESIWENPGSDDQRYILILYDQYENPTAITTPFPSTGHPFREFKYDQWHRLREYLGNYGNGFFEFWHFYGFDLNGRIGVDTMYTSGKLLDKPTDYFERTISQIQYDNQGRIIHVSNINNYGASSVNDYDYDAAGNLVYPSGPPVTYDHKFNIHRTNDIWMFLARDYSMNNPIIADTYNPAGFPTMNNSSAPDRGFWAVPGHLGPEVNSPSRELGSELSPDGLSLYFDSDRPTTNGLLDIYVSHRACQECPWQQAQILGPVINGPTSNDGQAALSQDGHLICYSSNRVGSMGAQDLWVSHREDPKNDLGWETPVNLGPLVNTTTDEFSPSFVGRGAHSELYFSRGGVGTLVVPISQQGVVLGPAVTVDFGGDAGTPSVTNDGRAVVFFSNSTLRPGLGEGDIFMETREHASDPWSAAVNLGGPVNSIGGELEAGISDDGNTLVFSGTMTRGGSLGRQDIWISTRKQYFSFANTDIYLNHSQISYGCRQSYW